MANAAAWGPLAIPHAFVHAEYTERLLSPYLPTPEEHATVATVRPLLSCPSFSSSEGSPRCIPKTTMNFFLALIWRNSYCCCRMCLQQLLLLGSRRLKCPSPLCRSCGIDRNKKGWRQRRCLGFRGLLSEFDRYCKNSTDSTVMTQCNGMAEED